MPNAELDRLEPNSTGLLLRALASAAIVLIVIDMIWKPGPEMLAAIRPDEQSFALLLHLVGATVVFGALLASATSLLLARGDTRLLRLGYFSLLLVALPGLDPDATRRAMALRPAELERATHQFNNPAWLEIGFIVADWGGVLFLISLASAQSASAASARQGTTGLLNTTMLISLVLSSPTQSPSGQ